MCALQSTITFRYESCKVQSILVLDGVVGKLCVLQSEWVAALVSERCSSRGCYVVIAASVYGWSASGSSNSYGQ